MCECVLWWSVRWNSRDEMSDLCHLRHLKHMYNSLNPKSAPCVIQALVSKQISS